MDLQQFVSFTTEDSANEPWALWIKQRWGWGWGLLAWFEHLRNSTVQEAMWLEPTVAAGSHLHRRKKSPRLARLTGPFSVQSARECFVRCIKKKVLCGFYLAAVSLARAICCRVEFPSPRTSFKMLWPETRTWSLELFITTPDTS